MHVSVVQVEKLEDLLETAQADQKNLFLIIFQRFIMILSEHLVRCDTDEVTRMLFDLQDMDVMQGRMPKCVLSSFVITFSCQKVLFFDY